VAGKVEAQRRKIHLKTAKTLGIDVRSTLLATADESSNNSAHAVFCAGFWTPGCRHYPRGFVAGVQKAPRHEIAGRKRGRCRVRYGDFAAGSGLLRLD
jgi:hypothetical protein